MPHIRRTPEQIKKDAEENLKELKEKIKKKYPDIIYTHLSTTPIKNLIDYSNFQFSSFEPKGLYFSKEYQWFIENVIDKNNAKYNKYLYGIQIKDKNILLSINKPSNKNKILNIKTNKDMQLFVDRYLVPNTESICKMCINEMYYIDIDFKKVKNDYGGILFTYNKNEIIDIKYKGLDIILSPFTTTNYGCIWRTSIIDNFLLLAKYNTKAKKFITTFD